MVASSTAAAATATARPKASGSNMEGGSCSATSEVPDDDDLLGFLVELLDLLPGQVGALVGPEQQVPLLDQLVEDLVRLFRGDLVVPGGQGRVARLVQPADNSHFISFHQKGAPGGGPWRRYAPRDVTATCCCRCRRSRGLRRAR